MIGFACQANQYAVSYKALLSFKKLWADQLRITTLTEAAAEFSIHILKKNGVFLAKLFENGASETLSSFLKKYFKTVKYFKPKASRRDSYEIYLVAEGFL